jgi:hypothetical protein
MSKEFREFVFILGYLVIVAMSSVAFHAPSGPGSMFVPALVMTGGAALLTIAPLKIWRRVFCFLVLLGSLFQVKSEWNDREKARANLYKKRTETLIETFNEERKQWEKERRTLISSQK